nr:hypothetical protein [Tanacetum cinerariifolium]
MRTSRTKKQYIDRVEACIKYAVHNLQKMRNIDPRVTIHHSLVTLQPPVTIYHTLVTNHSHQSPSTRRRTKKQYIDGVEACIKYAVHNLQKMRNIDPRDEQAKTAQIPVNATTEFIDDIDFDMDLGLEIPTNGPATIEMVNATKESFYKDDLAKFQELLLDADKPLYKGCPDFTKLSAIVKLLNLKGKYGASDKFFTELLGLLKKMLPAGNEMVEKTYQAKKLMRMMGSGYKKIHVCSNNCILYLKDNKELTVCLTCGISRWKVDNKTHKVYENIPAKVMWYFPIIPRLQRFFKLESISENLRWHATRRITYGVLRQPTDSQAWRTIDEKFPEIAKDPRNLWLGISADGVDVNSRTRLRELAISKDSVSETVSGVSVEALDLHITKEVATTRKAFYYGVLQEIWVLDYRFRQIPLFKCDWVNHKAGGVKHDLNLGYTLVDLNSLGHEDDPFILASQARQVFYVKDQIEKKLSIVFRTPTKNTKIHMTKSIRNLVQSFTSTMITYCHV